MGPAVKAALLAAPAVLALCACSPAPVADAEASRVFTEHSVHAAVGRPGVRVCRRFGVGIADSDLVAGVVVRANASDIAVRIDNPGRFPQLVRGAAVSKGAVIWDTATAWTPCLVSQ
jgi:hypothetical protein